MVLEGMWLTRDPSAWARSSRILIDSWHDTKNCWLTTYYLVANFLISESFQSSPFDRGEKTMMGVCVRYYGLPLDCRLGVSWRLQRSAKVLTSAGHCPSSIGLNFFLEGHISAVFPLDFQSIGASFVSVSMSITVDTKEDRTFFYVFVHVPSWEIALPTYIESLQI